MTQQEQEFSVIDGEKMEKAQKIITMIKEQEEFDDQEANEIINFIYEKLGAGQ